MDVTLTNYHYCLFVNVTMCHVTSLGAQEGPQALPGLA